MLKTIKKLSCIMIVITITMILCLDIDVYASTDKTGHPYFDEIIIPEDKDVYLLVNSSLSVRKKQLSKVKWRLFGTSVYTEVYKQKVTFKRPNVFVRSNKTGNVIEYDYKFNSSLKAKLSFQKDEKSKADFTAKIGKFGGGVEADVNEALGVSIESGVSQELSYTITVSPHSKLTIYSTGEAYLSQGALKYYLFGVPVYQTNWEHLEVIAEHYEFYEEKYN